MPSDETVPQPAKRKGCGCGAIVLASVVLAIILGLCGAFDDDPKAGMIAKAEVQITQRLRDPSSFERGDERVFEENGIYVVVISYRAKNGFGGYESGSAAFEFDKGGNLIRQR